MRGTFFAFLTNVIDDLGEIGTVPFIFQMNVLKTSVTSRKTISCLNVCLPCCSDTLQAPKICAVAHTSLLHQIDAHCFSCHSPSFKVGWRWECVIFRS